jgi:UDP-4-amino-4,6-dideoxy-N-acetyl-beta-L-altrosamine N-acetyltransferase
MNELRPLAPADAPTLLRWRNLPEVSRYMYTDHAISPEEHAEWFDRTLRREDVRYWVIAVDGVDVGVVNIVDIDTHHRTCSWAFYIAETAARGKGTGAFTEFTILELVFSEMGLRKLSCEVLETNPEVLAMHERFGFVREGRFREQILKEGAPVDVHRLAILASEWSEVRDGHREALLEKGILAPQG